MTWPWEVHLDRKTCLAGVYSDPNTTWTLPFTDSTINCIVLSDDFGATAGTILTPDSNDGTSVVIAGDYSAGCAMLGRLYGFSIELTRPFKRKYSGESGTLVSDLDAWVTIRKIIASYRSSGPVTIRATLPNRSDRTKTFTQNDGTLSSDDIKTLEAWFNGHAEEMAIFLESTSPKKVIIPTVDIKIDHESRAGDRW